MPRLTTLRPLVGQLVAGYGYFGVSAFITVLVVPLYPWALGAGQWGLLAICLGLQGAVLAMEALLAPQLARAITRERALGDSGSTQAIWHQQLRRHVRIAATGVLLGQLLLLLPLGHPDVVWVLRLALLQVLFQFCNSVHIGYWSAQQQHARAGRRLGNFMLLRHASALLMLWLGPTNALTCMLAFTLVSAIEFSANYVAVRRSGFVNIAPEPYSPMPSGLAEQSRYRTAVVLSVLCVHIDRLVLMVLLPVTQFGSYFLLSLLLLSILHLQVPLTRIFLPRIATTSTPRREAAAMLKAGLVLLVVPSILLALGAETVLWLWLHDPVLAADQAGVLRLMLLAAALQALYGPAHALLLRAHRYRPMVVISSLCLAAQVLILLVLTPQLGAIAGGLAWLACGVIQLLAAAWIWRQHGST